jgi:hypothetical protein
VSENRELRKISGHQRKWQEAGEDCTMRNLYTSPNIIRVIKSRIMRWAGHGIRMGEMRNEYRILVGKPEPRKS